MPMPGRYLDRYAADDDVDVIWLLNQHFGVPHTALGGEKIAVIDMNGAADFAQRINHGMNDVTAQNGHVTTSKRFLARSLNLPGGRIGDAPPEHVVFTPAIHPDDIGQTDGIDRGGGRGPIGGIDTGASDVQLPMLQSRSMRCRRRMWGPRTIC
jgi:hypothetical protein